MKICSRGLWDETVPGISFDNSGISNFAVIQERLMRDFPRGEKGLLDWEEIVKDAKKKNSKYDCLVGVSGGVDSSYLLHVLKKEYGLNPLAVYLDNGWGSNISTRNIFNVTKKLGIDLKTNVIDYEVIKRLQKTFMKAGLPWIDTPTDLAIKSTMIKYAKKYGIKYVFRGNDFRTEGKQPKEWTSSDFKQLDYLFRKFYPGHSYKNYPKHTVWELISSKTIYKLKDLRPFYYLEYDKASAKKFLEQNYDWEYYGGHHHENLFTKYAMSVWLPDKFGIDKRKITYSAQVLSGLKTRDEALEEINTPELTKDQKNELVEFVRLKLDLSKEEYEAIFSGKNHYFYDYPSNQDLIKNTFKKYGRFMKLFYTNKPMSLYEFEERDAKSK